MPLTAQQRTGKQEYLDHDFRRCVLWIQSVDATSNLYS